MSNWWCAWRIARMVESFKYTYEWWRKRNELLPDCVSDKMGAVGEEAFEIPTSDKNK